MTSSARDRRLQLKIARAERADVYLSCSWRPGAGQDAAWAVVRALDQAEVRAVGDVRDLDDQDDERIRRIMRGCSGFVSVLPYRDDTPSTTSSFMIRELRIAAALGLPAAVLHADGVRISDEPAGDRRRLAFPSEEPVDFAADRLASVSGYNPEGSMLPEKIALALNSWQGRVLSTPAETTPYAFLVTRLEDDFVQARLAVKTAVEEAAGIPCLWSDDQRHATNIAGIRERARLLIEGSVFTVADLSRGSESPDSDNPSRAHEVGMAVAYERPLMLTAQGPRRDPYYSADDIQIHFWDSEQDLRESVRRWIHTHRAVVARTVYNWELADRDPSYVARVSGPAFTFDAKQRYVAANAFALATWERWMVAASFSAIALSLAAILQEVLGFDDTFDFAPIVAAIFTLVFSSDLGGSIRLAFRRARYLRWLVPLVALFLLAGAFLSARWERPDPPEAPTAGAATAPADGAQTSP